MRTLLDRAEAAIQAARLLLSPEGNPTDDRLITNSAAYHTQQGIKLALVYQAELFGLPHIRTHKLSKVIRIILEAGCSVTSELCERSSVITKWDIETRYNVDFFVHRKDIEEAIQLYEDLKTSILHYIEEAQ